MWQILKLKQTSDSFFLKLCLTSSFAYFCLLENFLCRQRQCCSALAATWNPGLMGCCQAVVALLSLNQSFAATARLPALLLCHCSAALFSSPFDQWNLFLWVLVAACWFFFSWHYILVGRSLLILSQVVMQILTSKLLKQSQNIFVNITNEHY